MIEIEEKIQIDGADSMLTSFICAFVRKIVVERWWDFRPLFMTHADRQRVYMVILIGMRLV